MRPSLPLGLLPVAAVLGVFFLWPMGLAVQAAFTSAGAWHWLADDYARNRIAGGVLQAVLSLALALAVALPLAFLHHRWRIPGSRLLLAVHAAAFVLPVFVVVAGLRETLGAGGWLDRAMGVDALSALGPWGAVALANAYYNAGLAAVLLHTALERRPRRLEEAAASLGAAPAAVWSRVSWPLLRPAAMAAALLVFLFCLGSFGVVLLLGEGRIDTIDTLLYANLGGAFPPEDRAAVLALVQITLQGLLLVGVLALERRAARNAVAPTPRQRPSSAAATATAWILAALAITPAVAVLTGAFQVGGDWSLDAWRALTGGPDDGHLYGFNLARAVGLSVGYALAAVVAALALTLLLGYAAKGTAARVTEVLAFLPLGTSSVVLGFAFLFAFAGRTWLPLIGSPWGIVAAHTLIAFPFVARTVLPALRSLDASLDDSAASLGASLPARIVRLHLPLLRGPLSVAAAFAAALSLGDYGASLILMTDDTMSIAVWIDRHGGPGAFDPLARAQSTALAAVLLVLTLACIVAAAALGPRRRPHA
ncbi:MAG: ABC transporter permease subunit [Candidatus Thermoplasmatota archaeon]